MKKFILAISVLAILVSAGSVIAQGPGSGGKNKAFKLIDATGRDLGYLVSLASTQTSFYSGDRNFSFYTTYDQDLDVFLTWPTAGGGPMNVVSVDAIYFSQPNCVGDAYNITQFEGVQKPDCNTPIIPINTNFWYRMKTCKMVTATISSKISHNECTNIPTTTVEDAYLTDSFEGYLIAPPTPPFKVIQK